MMKIITLKQIKHIMKRLVTIILCLFFLTLTFTCREDVVAPGSPVGQKNTPVKNKNSKLYTFLIDAKNYTVKIKDDLAFQSSAFNVNACLTFYEFGSVRLNLIAEDGSQVVTHLFNRDEMFEYILGFNYLPAAIEIEFFDFTGILNVEIHSIILG